MIDILKWKDLVRNLLARWLGLAVVEIAVLDERQQVLHHTSVYLTTSVRNGRLVLTTVNKPLMYATVQTPVAYVWLGVLGTSDGVLTPYSTNLFPADTLDVSFESTLNKMKVGD